MKRLMLMLLLFACGTAGLSAALVRQEWVVDGTVREALVSIPAGISSGAPVPVVFAFHGHGGSMRQASRSFPIHEHWPEAIVVYPQGLPTPSPLVDREGKKTGWQSAAGSEGDRDLHFFDAMLSSLRAKYRIDDRRIFATGHSNGGLFTYLLWAERGETFAAFAPSAALLTHGFASLKPKPVFHIASPQDPLVKFACQERMLDYVLQLDGCGPFQSSAMGYTAYPSTNGTDVAVLLHSGGHRYPGEAPALIVKFFQAHTKA